MGRSSALVVIPAFNEELNLPKVLAKLSGLDCLVVDDGSEDRTADTAELCGSFVIRLGQNQGYDSALAAGISWAIANSYEFAVTCDADGQHSDLDVRSAIALLSQGADLAVGSRPGGKRFAERVFALYARKLHGIVDPMCGLKGYRLSCISCDISTTLKGTIGSGLAFAFSRSQRLIVNFAIEGIPRISGKSKFGKTVTANISIVKGLWQVVSSKSYLERFNS
jgi:glycosyltransferase involved in cell wall biosynthesis